MTQIIKITPHDPLLFRDPRPFSAGAVSARTMTFPLPSVTAGVIRTLVGRKEGIDFKKKDSKERIKQLLNISVCGPLLYLGGRFYFPAPKDAVLIKDGANKRIIRLKPIEFKNGEGANLPSGLSLIGDETLPVKQEKMPDFWPSCLMGRWLENQDFDEHRLEDGFTPEIDRRTHVKIKGETYAHEEGMLFSTEGTSFLKVKEDDFKVNEGALVVKVEANDVSSLQETLHRIGGEGRFAKFEEDNQISWPAIPNEVKEAISKTGKVKLQLATPAVFSGGWRPGWIDEKSLEGTPRGVNGVQLKLVGACVPRWQPLSGWDLKEKRAKALRRMVPAGSVYFFEVENGDAASLAESLWLKPVSDDAQDQKDGFGLALWGTW